MSVNYNSGEWFGWNGGECPVHPETVVEYRGKNTGPCDISHGVIKASERSSQCWEHTRGYPCNPIIAFRVIKEHKEPRDWWLFANRVHTVLADAEIARESIGGFPSKIIHVREVLE